MFELAERGHRSLFEQLVSCIISIRTRDEVSLPAAFELFERAPTPAAIAKLSVAQIEKLIHASTFHGAKAPTIQAIAGFQLDAGKKCRKAHEHRTAKCPGHAWDNRTVLAVVADLPVW